jgi:hypothetical protein
MTQDNKTMEQATTFNNKKVWSEPEMTLLSVKDNTLGGGATSADATTLS